MNSALLRRSIERRHAGTWASTLVLLLLSALTLLLTSASAGAQGLGLPGAGSVPSSVRGPAEDASLAISSSEATHAWFIEPSSAPPAATSTSPAQAPRAVVLHAPPRGASTPFGTIRVATDLLRVPVAVAAADARFYMVFQDPAPPPAFAHLKPPPRRVQSISAEQITQGRWATRPFGRLDVHPFLPGEGGLVGIAASDAGLFALMLSDAGDTTLLRMEPDGWSELPGPVWGRTPSRLPRSSQEFRIFGVPGGVGVARLDEVRPAEIAIRTGEAWTQVDAPTADPRPDLIAMVGHSVVAASRPPGGSLSIRALSLRGEELPGDGWRDLARIDSVEEVWGAAPLASSNALAVVWHRKPPAGAPEGELTRRMMAEVSLGTGRVLFEGEASSGSPVSRKDAWLLGLAVSMVTGMVIVTVLRPPTAPVVLPKNTSLAPPLRRLFAGMIDFGLGLAVAGMLAGRGGWSELGWWITPDGQWLMLTVLPCMSVICGLSEGLSGRTLGKLAMGIRVSSIRVQLGNLDSPPEPPGVARGLLRNIIKWCLPPVGLIALLDPEGRHRADQFAMTAVVLPDDPDDEEAEQGGSDDL